MTINLSKRMDTLSESMTIAISTLAKELKKNGKDIVSFSAGEPDFDTPQVIKDHAIEALNNGETKYTAVAGTLEVREAIVNKLKKENNLSYKPTDIMVNVGAKHSLFNLFQALVDNDDEVIIPAPYWVTYPELAKYSGGVPIKILTSDENDFKITPAQLINAITAKTKVLILTTPSNPTGSVYSKSELEDIAEVLKDTNIWVISDEMYEKLIYDNLTFTATASINEDMFNRTITVNGLSKSVAMTGWRFGYLATPNNELVKAMTKLQSQSTSNINSITQYASIAVFEGKANKDIEIMRVEFQKRRDLACDLFNKIDGLNVVKPQGAFYLYVNIKKIEENSLKFCEKLLENAGVAVIPGIGFGLDGYFRFSFATDEDTIKDGISRIENFVKNYR
jgi:aspartate aminotransferase